MLPTAYMPSTSLQPGPSAVVRLAKVAPPFNLLPHLQKHIRWSVKQ